jgi:hypothetical protein
MLEAVAGSVIVLAHHRLTRLEGVFDAELGNVLRSIESLKAQGVP